ncbi:MAG: hypothetical protein RBT61_09795 [Candidatus Kapabacteria bacterium]|jgi:hypothetical protein|nr:hypothetical protein [Candidatus Kapabacteria bacterium]
MPSNPKALIRIILEICFIVGLFAPVQSFSQPILTEESTESPFYFSIIGGYNGLFKGTDITQNANGTDFIHGGSFGLAFEYKLPNTKTYLQLSTESSRMNFKTMLDDNFQNLRFTSLGLKMHPNFAQDFYLTIGAGIMTGAEISSRMYYNINLGYDYRASNNKIIFFQVGGFGTDFNDNILTFRFGFRINL